MKAMKPSGRESAARFYEFGPFRLDTEKRLLARDGEPVTLTPKAYETLLALIKARARVLEKTELMEILWPDSFVEENNLNQSISTLRKALGERADVPLYIKTVPGHGYRFVATVTESTGEEAVAEQDRTGLTDSVATDGVEKTGGPKRSGKDSLDSILKSTTRHGLGSPRPLMLAVAALLAVVLAIALFYHWRRSNTEQSPGVTHVKSLAVLPFKSLGAGTDEYLGLGMTDVLITRLSNLRSLIVRPTSAVRKYAGQEKDPSAAGRELQVESVLEGTIQRVGEKVRVSVRLLNTSDGRPLWGETFDEKFTDIFAVEDSISRRLAESLALKLSGDELKRLARRYTDNVEAYQLYLKGRYYSRTWTAEGFQKALDNFNQAINLDPTFALAYAGLADAYYRASTVYLPLQEASAKAKAAAIEALRIDDDLAEAHASLGAIKFRYEWDFGGAESEFKRAIELNPSYSTAHQWYSEYLTAMGRFQEGLEEAKLAQQIDPLSPEVGWDLGLSLLFGRRYDEAVAEFKTAIELDQKFWLTHSFLGWAYAEKGEYDQAFAEYEKARTLDDNPDILSQLVYVYSKAGLKTDAQRMLDELVRRSKSEYVSPFYLAAAYVGVGDKDRAFTWLQKALEERSELLVFLKVAPTFDSVRSDPRFIEVMRRVGLAP